MYICINKPWTVFICATCDSLHNELPCLAGALWIRDTLNISKSEAHSTALLTRLSELFRIMKYASNQLNLKKTIQIWQDKIFSPSFSNLPKQSSMVVLSTFLIHVIQEHH